MVLFITGLASTSLRYHEQSNVEKLAPVIQKKQKTKKLLLIQLRSAYKNVFKLVVRVQRLMTNKNKVSKSRTPKNAQKANLRKRRK